MFGRYKFRIKLIYNLKSDEKIFKIVLKMIFSTITNKNH